MVSNSFNRKSRFLFDLLDLPLKNMFVFIHEQFLHWDVRCIILSLHYITWINFPAAELTIFYVINVPIHLAGFSLIPANSQFSL